ncbi:MAG: SDR family NAD(P)-dependent oxidoreductase [Candidatus Omnitrophota bacterium]
MSKTVLITGGAGFIGSHLARALIKKGQTVYILDDLSTGYVENIRDIKDHQRLHLVTGSITDEALLSKTIEKCDFIYHLAATVGVKRVVKHPLDTIICDTFGTELILKYASTKKMGVLLTSTSEVYGKTAVFPFKENSDITLGPPDINRWSYACSKLLDEFLAMAYHRERELQVVILRLFNIVGPGQVGHYGMVVPRFFKSALANTPMHVYGDGSQVRCFTYIDDAIHILLKLASSKKANGEIINLGHTEQISIRELAMKIKILTASSAKIVFEPYYKYYGPHFQDIKRRVPDLTKLKKIAGCVPQIGVNEILKKLKDHYSKNPKELERI